MTSKYLYPGKLVQHSDNAFSTHAAYYNRNYKDNTRRMVGPLVSAVEFLMQHLKLDSDVRYVIKPLHQKTDKRQFAFYLPRNKTVFIDCRLNSYKLAQLLASLTHESIHAEQQQTGICVPVKDGFLWHGQLHLYSFNVKESMDVYHNHPWEKDVADRIDPIFWELVKHLDEEAKVRSELSSWPPVCFV